MKRPIKILVWGDSPAASTGFGTVVKGIFKPLAESGDYQIDIIGINDTGDWKDPKEHPYRIFPARQLITSEDFFGRPRLISALMGNDKFLKPPWDIVFTLNDPFILEQPIEVFNKGTMVILKDVQAAYKVKVDPINWFKIVSYWPIDSHVKGNWIEQAISLPDVSVAYTEYGKREILKSNSHLDAPHENLNDSLPVIYHGVNTNVFKRLPKEETAAFRKKYFREKLREETFLVGAVARNQMRKDLPRTMMIYKEFQKRRPDSFLYLHSKPYDAWGSILEYAREIDLIQEKDFAFPAKFSENVGFPVESLNKIYNSMDCLVSTSHGEGFGLPIIESMAAQVLNFAPQHTAIPELFNTTGLPIDDMDELIKHDIRGIPIKNYSTKSEWVTYGPQDLERIRPLVNVEDFVKKLVWAYDHPVESAKIAERGKKWAEQFTWERIASEWDKLFVSTFKQLEEERKVPPIKTEDVNKKV